MSNIRSINININTHNNRIGDYSGINDIIHTQSRSNTTKSSGRNNSVAREIDFSEGCELVSEGFLNGMTSIIKSIIKHPVQALAAAGITTGALIALPLIGIPATTGASVLCCVFGTLAIGKTLIDGKKAFDHNKEGNNTALREDLQKIGGDGLDLALSLPFFPKAVAQINRQVKYAPKASFNKELWSELVNVIRKPQNFWNVMKNIAKEDLRISYKTYVNEMGFKIAPELEFGDMPNIVYGVFFDKEARIFVNSRNVEPFKLFLTQTTTRHELQHYKQITDVVRTEGFGPAAIEKAELRAQELAEILDKNTRYSEENRRITAQFWEEVKKHPEKLEEIKSRISYSEKLPITGEFNRDFYNKVIQHQGKIAANTPEAAQAARYYQGYSEYPAGASDFNVYKDNILRLREEEQLYYLSNIEADANATANKVSGMNQPNIYIAMAQSLAGLFPDRPIDKAATPKSLSNKPKPTRNKHSIHHIISQ